jgi:hypothetical protein
VEKSKEVKTGINLEESSMKGCGSKNGCFYTNYDEPCERLIGKYMKGNGRVLI